MHGIRSDLLKEIEAKKGPGKFPIITALFSDTSLQNRCTCGNEDSLKRLSYSPGVGLHTDVQAHGGDGVVMTRPLSWHSEQFNVDNPALQLYANYNGAAAVPMQQQQQQQLLMTSQSQTAATPSQYTNMSTNHHEQQHQHHKVNNNTWVTHNGSLHQSMDSLDIGVDYPTMVTHPSDQIPTQLHTGLSGTKSLDNLLRKQHYCNLVGLAS